MTKTHVNKLNNKPLLKNIDLFNKSFKKKANSGLH